MGEFYTHIVRLGKPREHGNADRLEVFDVMGEYPNGYPVCVKKGEFKEHDLAIYLSVDASPIPTSDPRFDFLVPFPKRKDDATDVEWAERLRRYERERNQPCRIRALKLRGVYSQGLLLPLSAKERGLGEGADIGDLLGIVKYEPDADNLKPSRAGGSFQSGEAEPRYETPYYDIEGIRRYGSVFQPGDEVVVTCKVHGSSSSYVFDSKQQRLIVNSRNQTKRRPGLPTRQDWLRYWVAVVQRYCMLAVFAVTPKRLAKWLDLHVPKTPRPPRETKACVWWDVAVDLDLETKLQNWPDVAFYGEVYGPTQDLHYGSPTRAKFVCFDAFNMKTKRWLEYDDLKVRCAELDIPMVPELYRGPWKEELRELAEQDSVLAAQNGAPGQIAEGIVIKAIPERKHGPSMNRAVLKLVSQKFLLR